MECYLGVILGTFGGQVGPSSVQNASWKLINIKNVNFHHILRFPIPERFFEPQDGTQNAPRSAQDGSKRLLESNFFALENRLKFCLVLDAILVDFGPPNPSPKVWGKPPPFRSNIGLYLTCYLCHILIASKTPQEAPKSPQDPPKSAPRGSQRPPRAPQEAPRGLQETPRAGQEGSTTTKMPC